MSPLLDAFSLDGKVAIVTGASSGLGVAFATGLAEAGADIAICARRVDRLEQTKQQVEALGRRCIAVEEDASLIVVGAGDRGKTTRRLMGGVADLVAERAPCNVLIVRPSPEP